MITLIFTSSIACTQPSLQDSLCFSKEEASKIMKTIKKVDVQDSIIINQKLQIINFKEIVKNDSEQKSVLENQLLDKDKQLNKAVLRLKISTTINKFGLPSVFICGLLIGIILN